MMLGWQQSHILLQFFSRLCPNIFNFMALCVWWCVYTSVFVYVWQGREMHPTVILGEAEQAFSAVLSRNSLN